MAKKALWAAIVLASLGFGLVYLFLGYYALAGFAFGAGLLWLLFELRENSSLAAVFFFCFGVLAVTGSLRHLAAPFMPVGMALALAAWDLSRFCARTQGLVSPEVRPTLDRRHLVRLGTTLAAGTLLALLPLYVHVSLSFVVFFFIALTAVWLIRWAAVSLRG